MIGEKIRQARVERDLSLAQVAEKAGISIATLSRIETEKQTLDMDLFLTLSKILRKAPQEFLGGAVDGEGDDKLAARIVALGPPQRAQLWRELTEERRSQRSRRSAAAGARQQLNAEVEELAAQIDFLREEIESVRIKIRRRR